MRRQSGFPPHCSLGMGQRKELWTLYLPVEYIVASNAFWAHNPECGLLGETSPIPFDHMINHVAARFLQKRLTEKDKIECFIPSGL